MLPRLAAVPGTNVAPSLAFSTFLGSPAFDEGTAVAVDGQGNAYVTGSTVAGGTEDVLLLEVTAEGKRGTLWYTIGGSGADRGQAVAVDALGNVWVTGTTGSADFYRTNAAQPALRGFTDLFVVKLGPSGNALFSTYLGGGGLEPDSQSESVSIAVDREGNGYIASSTTSTDYPTTAGSYQPRLKDDYPADQLTFSDAVVTKLGPAGRVLYSTHIGGNGSDAAYGLAVDASGRAWVVGQTASPDFPLVNPPPFAPKLGGRDSFLCRLSADGASLEYSTLLGLAGCRAVCLDGAGNVYLTGYATGGLPTTPGAFQINPSDNRSWDAYLLKLSPDGKSVLFATYLGGNGTDQGMAVAANSAGFVAVTGVVGFTPFKNFPTHFSLYPYRNNLEGFAAKFAPDGTILYSTYLGGNSNDEGHGIALDAAGNVLVTGSTESADFPMVSALRTNAFGGEGFLARIVDVPAEDSPAANPKLFSNFGFSLQSGRPVGFSMDILVPPTLHYYLQRSTDLVNWEVEAPFQADLDGTFHYSDIFAGSYNRKFYRVVINTNFYGGGGKK
ncbi:MAG: SBBP repeat-containing protein [Verrucomicrobiota bacterium]